MNFTFPSSPISLMSTPISQHHHCHLHLQAAQHVGLLHLLLHFPPMLLEAPGILAGEWVPCDLSETLNIISLPIWALCRAPSVCVCVSAVAGLCMHIPNQPLHMILLPPASLLPFQFSFAFLPLLFCAFLQLS